ncbi:hypothetical protein [Kitasatospora sp. HPMI-4]|uniref:hypothetical protein n=1 Tax=Kitasatospora sp. HPMI-4 TaxID=3448443 RepID=UPI003F1C7F87
MPGRLIRIGYTLALLAVVLGTLLNPNLFGLSDEAWLLTLIAELVLGLLLLSLLMAALPRRLQVPIAGALPTSAAQRRRLDGLLTALRLVKPRSADLDIADLATGTTLYARAVRTDTGRQALGLLFLSAPAAGDALICWRKQALGIDSLRGPYTLTRITGARIGGIARRLRATETVQLSGTGELAITVQVTPMDLLVLQHVVAASQPTGENPALQS